MRSKTIRQLVQEGTLTCEQTTMVGNGNPSLQTKFRNRPKQNLGLTTLWLFLGISQARARLERTRVPWPRNRLPKQKQHEGVVSENLKFLAWHPICVTSQIEGFARLGCHKDPPPKDTKISGLTGSSRRCHDPPVVEASSSRTS